MGNWGYITYNPYKWSYFTLHTTSGYTHFATGGRHTLDLRRQHGDVKGAPFGFLRAEKLKTAWSNGGIGGSRGGILPGKNHQGQKGSWSP